MENENSLLILKIKNINLKLKKKNVSSISRILPHGCSQIQLLYIGEYEAMQEMQSPVPKQHSLMLLSPCIRYVKKASKKIKIQLYNMVGDELICCTNIHSVILVIDTNHYKYTGNISYKFLMLLDIKWEFCNCMDSISDLSS